MPVAAEPAASLLGLPLVPFEALEDRFPPARYDLLIAIGPHQVNAPRAARFEEGRAKGYRFARYVDSGARLWPDLEMRPGCRILANAVVELCSRIGGNSLLRPRLHPPP